MLPCLLTLTTFSELDVHVKSSSMFDAVMVVLCPTFSLEFSAVKPSSPFILNVACSLSCTLKERVMEGAALYSSLPPWLAVMVTLSLDAVLAVTKPLASTSAVVLLLLS